VSLTSDRVCLDYRNYEGNPVRLLFRRCTPLGRILHTECCPFVQRYVAWFPHPLPSLIPNWLGRVGNKWQYGAFKSKSLRKLIVKNADPRRATKFPRLPSVDFSAQPCRAPHSAGFFIASKIQRNTAPISSLWLKFYKEVHQ
jgi:hypothetical protein